MGIENSGSWAGRPSSSDAVGPKIGNHDDEVIAAINGQIRLFPNQGVLVMTVYLEPGQVPDGGFETPTKTMFQFCPDQVCQISFRESHCCWVLELIVESILESARKPPLDHAELFVFARFKLPLTCMRRNQVPCDTAQVMVLAASKELLAVLVGVTAKFSHDLQKVVVAL